METILYMSPSRKNTIDRAMKLSDIDDDLLSLAQLETILTEVIKSDFDTQTKGKYSLTRICEWPDLIN